jgi:hypothetical protein
LNIATGTVITDIRANHTSADFIAYLNKMNRNVPAGLDVHVILDNLFTHKTPIAATGTRTPHPSFGTRPPSRSSNDSPATAWQSPPKTSAFQLTAH